MGRRRLLVASFVAAVFLTVSTVAYRSAYGTWWRAPERISYCDRIYVPGTTDLSLGDVHELVSRAGVSGDDSDRLAIIGKAPPIVGGEMLAVVTPDVERRKHQVPCTMALYLRTGEDAYTAYGLSGGP